MGGLGALTIAGAPIAGAMNRAPTKTGMLL